MAFSFHAMKSTDVTKTLVVFLVQFSLLYQLYLMVYLRYLYVFAIVNSFERNYLQF